MRMPKSGHTDSKKKLISISTPILNEEVNIPILYERLVSLANNLEKYDFEFVFTDNRSTDASWELIGKFSKIDPRVRGFRFTRNVGVQNSILMNYSLTNGDAVFTLEADMQDPPELLPEFLDAWESGNKVVYGIRRSRQEGWIDQIFRRLGYWAVDTLSVTPIPRNVGDFGILDREVIDDLIAQRNPKPYIRGMIAGMGHVSTGIVYDRDARKAGESKISKAKVLALACREFLALPLFPFALPFF